MTRKKIVVILLFMILGLQYSFSQNYKFKTSGFSVLEKKENGKWGKWSDLDLVNILVTLDTNKNRIVIYSQVIQLFEIIEYQATEENETDIVYSFTCKDNNGDDCTLSIITRKKQGNRKQLYINYDDRIIVYNIFNM
ncbi:hypothetical protein ACM55G_09930 [Flavobacterium sp. LB3P122]|uniref:hypothetical protein n=1 Tax=Flavobacterium algoriphilum TaxID=3398738 RepID=UPI003A88B642